MVLTNPTNPNDTALAAASGVRRRQGASTGAADVNGRGPEASSANSKNFIYISTTPSEVAGGEGGVTPGQREGGDFGDEAKPYDATPRSRATTATTNPLLYTASSQVVTGLPVSQPPVVKSLKHHVILEGMSCTSCASRVETALQDLPGVEACTVVFPTSTAIITTSATSNSKAILDEVQRVITGLGYRVTAVEMASPPAPSNPTHTLVVEGMSCVSCAGRVEKALNAMHLVESCTVVFATNTALLRTAGGLRGAEGRSVSDILNEAKEVIEGLGYHVTAIEVGGGGPDGSGDAAGTFAHQVIIEGMSCASCASRVESAVQELDGVARCRVDFTSSTASVHTAPGVDVDEVLHRVQSCIEGLGYRVTSVSAAQLDTGALEAKKNALKRSEELRRLRFSCVCSAILSIPVLAIMLYMIFKKHIDEKQMLILDCVQLVCVTPVVLYFGRIFFVGAWRSLWHRTFTMDTLVAIGTGLTYVYSLAAVILALSGVAHLTTYFDTAGLLTTFMLFGRFLEANAKRQTGGALLELMNLVPPTAMLVTPGGVDACIPYNAITEGALLRVLAGDRIPVDGSIAEGLTEIDEQMVTGESVPRAASPGDKVVGGTLNVSGAIVMRAEKVGEDTMLANILRIVQDAQSTKPAVQRIADRMAMYFVPMVLLLSLTTLVVWMVLGLTHSYPDSWRGSKPAELFAFEFFIATIVAACPCALGLATPTAIMVGAGMGAKNGVLVKSAATLEAVHRATCVVFDKTGTLTTGKLELVDSRWFTTQEQNREKIKQKASSADEELCRVLIRVVEERSNHPAALAVSAALQQDKLQEQSSCNAEAVDVITHHGEGLEARVVVRRLPLGGSEMRKAEEEEEHKVWVGNMRLLERCGVVVSEEATGFISRERALGRTMVFGVVDDQMRVVLSLSDVPKREARGVVAALHDLGLKTMVVTGDHRSAAEYVAASVGIAADCVHADILPVNKALIVKQAQEEGHRVIFVGDGINDGPALVQADVGVALGAGTEVAIEAADAVLIRDSLIDLLNLRDLSTVTVRRVYGNFVWALGYNVLMLPLASGALFPLIHVTLPPLLAGIAMVCSSLCVLLSSLSIRCFTPRKEKNLPKGNAIHEPVETLI